MKVPPVLQGSGRLHRHGVTFLDHWFIYAALAQTGTPEGLVKIGISVTPLERIANIHSGSPFPIGAGMFAPVGSRSYAAQLESRIHRAFAERNTRGEWFRFNWASVDDKQTFHRTINSLFTLITGRKAEWRKVRADDLAAYFREHIGKVESKATD